MFARGHRRLLDRQSCPRDLSQLHGRLRFENTDDLRLAAQGHLRLSGDAGNRYLRRHRLAVDHDLCLRHTQVAGLDRILLDPGHHHARRHDPLLAHGPLQGRAQGPFQGPGLIREASRSRDLNLNHLLDLDLDRNLIHILPDPALVRGQKYHRYSDLLKIIDRYFLRSES